MRRLARRESAVAYLVCFNGLFLICFLSPSLPEHCFAFGVRSRDGFGGRDTRPTGQLGANRDRADYEHFVV